MGQTATLFWARRRAFSNARHTSAAAFRPLAIGGAVFALAAIAGIGELAVSTMLTVPTDMATPTFGSRSPVAGDAALEAAFWLSTLLSSFFVFRVMESLFRSPKVRALELLPVMPAPIFIERSVNALAEAVAFSAVLTVFFVPLVWHGYGHVTALCALICLGSTSCAAAVTIGTNAWFGAQYGGASGLGDSYGGQGGAFLYAPMVSFAVAVVCVLMLQLGAREVLHRGAASNAFWLATGIAFSIAAVTLVVGGRHFVRSYHRVTAFFREADEVGFRAVMDYQTSAWEPLRWERLAGDGGAVFRRHVLQFGRRFPVARSLVTIGSVAAAIAAFSLSPEAFPNWTVAIACVALFAMLERPFSRIDDALLGGDADRLLPIDGATVERAAIVWSFYEIGRIALPYALFAGILRGWSHGLASGLSVTGLAIFAALAMPTAMAVARRAGVRRASFTNGLSLLVVIACGALGLMVSSG